MKVIEQFEAKDGTILTSAEYCLEYENFCDKYFSIISILEDHLTKKESDPDYFKTDIDIVEEFYKKAYDFALEYQQSHEFLEEKAKGLRSSGGGSIPLGDKFVWVYHTLPIGKLVENLWLEENNLKWYELWLAYKNR